MKAVPGARLAVFALDAGLVAGLLVLPVVWLIDPVALDVGFLHLWLACDLQRWLALLGLGVVRWLVARFLGGGSVAGLWRLVAVRKGLLAYYASFATLLALEGGLRAIGFEAELPPVIVQGESEERSGRNELVPDPEFRWRFSPGGTFKGWKINSLGFREREVDPVKKPGAMRVICLGDSCTADGGPPYAGCLHQLLTNAPPTDQEWEAFNMGVYGYSSVQGLRLLRKKVPALQPDIVTLYFGWNDHWLSGYRPDSSFLAFAMSPARARLYESLRHKRIGQLVVRLLTPGRNITVLKKDGKMPKELEDMYRVPHEEYRQTLTELAREIRAIGAVPLFLTAPRRREQHLGLVHAGQARSLVELTRVHDEYCQITRDVAEATGSPLLDLRTILPDQTVEPIFLKDGIHLTQHGLWRIGEELYRKIVALSAANPKTIPRPEPTPADLPGHWGGEAGNDTNVYRMTLRLDGFAATGTVCGAFSNFTLPCAGSLRWVDTFGATYAFRVEDRHGACVEDDTDDFVRLLPDGTLLFTSRGAKTETLGTLQRQPGP
jgi:lysophospholipase L1-like esterase